MRNRIARVEGAASGEDRGVPAPLQGQHSRRTSACTGHPASTCRKPSSRNGWPFSVRSAYAAATRNPTHGRRLRAGCSGSSRAMSCEAGRRQTTSSSKRTSSSIGGPFAHGVRGVNGYLFEWYGYFLHLLAHANYGWGPGKGRDHSTTRPCAACWEKSRRTTSFSFCRTFSQSTRASSKLFPAEFPFLKNNVSESDVPAIREAQKQWPRHRREARAEIISHCETHEECTPSRPALQQDPERPPEKPAHLRPVPRGRAYDNEKDPVKGRAALLREMESHNEKDFAARAATCSSTCCLLTGRA